VIEIGGTDQVSYRDLMVEDARQRGLRRLMIPVPVLTPRLSSLWLGLVDSREIIVRVPPATAFEPIRRVGGA
jgi:hypothetical protein